MKKVKEHGGRQGGHWMRHGWVISPNDGFLHYSGCKDRSEEMKYPNLLSKSSSWIKIKVIKRILLNKNDVYDEVMAQIHDGVNLSICQFVNSGVFGRGRG